MVLLLGKDQQAATKAQEAALFLSGLGFSINPTKSLPQVTKEVTFRGFVWNSERMEVWAPKEKLEDIRKAVKEVKCQNTTIQSLATLIRKVRYITQIHPLGWLAECQIFLKEFLKTHLWDASVHHLPEDVVQKVLHFRQRHLDPPTNSREYELARAQGVGYPTPLI
jgi:hypothetical protein